MKYNSSNKPLVCMQTHSTCYGGTRVMAPCGVLWHSTGANNNTLKRYVQPWDSSNSKEHPENTYTNAEWLKVLGKNQYGNDWNHIDRQAGLNCWIGKLADGTVATVQTMPWNYRPWGCGSGSKGSCNSGWMQFEICEDGLTDKNYFNAIYQEACELTAYYCKMFNIDPKGTVNFNGVTVPTILDHKESCELKLGNNHGDVGHWFKKHGKTMEDVRNDVAKLLGDTEPVSVKTYNVVTNIPIYKTSFDAKAMKNSVGTYAPGTYYIYTKYPNGYNGMLSITKNASGAVAGAWINPAENVAPVKDSPATKAVYDLEYPQKHLIIESGASSEFNKESCTKAIVAIKKNNENFDIEIAKVFFSLAPKYHINPMRAISQSVLETGWFKFAGSSVKAEQNNYCGLGATGGGVSGASFDTVENGVRAQLQHLYAYGCKDNLPSGETLVDPRFNYVTRGVAPYWEQLAGRWAVPGYDGNDAEIAVKNGNTYGQKITKICDGINSTVISESDIKLYFTDEEKDDGATQEAPTTEKENTKKDDEKIDVGKVNLVMSLLEKILTAIIKFFSKNQ